MRAVLVVLFVVVSSLLIAATFEDEYSVQAAEQDVSQILELSNTDPATKPDDPQIRVTNTWDGSSSTAWGTAANWSLNLVPISSHDVVIPTGMPRYPLVTTTLTVNSLQVQTGANVIIRSTHFIISNNFNVYGTLILDYAPANLDVMQDLHFHSGASVTINSAGINVQRTAYFDAGSNVDMDSGTLTFTGAVDSPLYIDAPTGVYNLVSAKDSGYKVHINSTSTSTLTIKGDLTVNYQSKFTSAYTGTTIIKGDFIVAPGAICQLDSGTLSMEGNLNTVLDVDAVVTFNYLYNLKVNKTNGYILSLSSSAIKVMGNLTIQSGTLDGQNTDYIFFYGNWINNIGPEYYLEGGCVELKGSGDQTFSTEHFSSIYNTKPSGTLIIPTGSTVTTENYQEWQPTTIIVSGSFTPDNYDCDWNSTLTVNGGTFETNEGEIIGTLTLNAGYINLYSGLYLTGNLVISGGEMHVYGGSGSFFGNSETDSFTMSGGLLDFHDHGMNFMNVSNVSPIITGGIIQIAHTFNCQRNDFHPTGGTVEMCGIGGMIQIAGSSFYNLRINLATPTDVLHVFFLNLDFMNLDINGSFTINQGMFEAPDYMSVSGNWTNNVGPAAFSQGTGTVIFDGSYNSYCYGEIFSTLELNKSGTGYLSLISGDLVTCSFYQWTSGRLWVSGGTFTALDIIGTTIQGTITLSSGYIHFYQSSGQTLNLRAALTISGGELHLYGSSGMSVWPSGGNASLTMSGGIIDVHDYGILIGSSAYTFTDNLTGGVIRTGGSFICDRGDFTPGGGTLELYGSGTSSLNMTTGTLYSLSINRPQSATPATCGLNLICTGDLTVNSGSLSLDGKTVSVGGNVAVYGKLILPVLSELKIANGKSLKVYSGGRLEAIGTDTGSGVATITRNGTSGSYEFSVESGGTLSARCALFEYMNGFGVNIKAGALVDAVNSLHYCTFRNGTSGLVGRLLSINNTQSIIVYNAIFPANTWSGAYNVYKGSDQGNVYFVLASGTFGGEAFDSDTYNRVSWTSMLPEVPSLEISHIPAANWIRLDWTYPDGISNFYIFRSNKPNGLYYQVGSCSSKNWSQALPGTRYFYCVLAYFDDASGAISPVESNQPQGSRTLFRDPWRN